MCSTKEVLGRSKHLRWKLLLANDLRRGRFWVNLPKQAPTSRCFFSTLLHSGNKRLAPCADDVEKPH